MSQIFYRCADTAMAFHGAMLAPDTKRAATNKFEQQSMQVDTARSHFEAHNAFLCRWFPWRCRCIDYTKNTRRYFTTEHGFIKHVCHSIMHAQTRLAAIEASTVYTWRVTLV